MGLITHSYGTLVKTEQNVHAQISELREALVKLESWPKAADDFIELMPYSRLPRLPIVEQDKEWLPKVVEAAVNHQDIGQKFPAFFQKLLLNSDLCEKFLLALRVKLRQA